MRMIQIQDNISEQKNLKDKLENEQEKLHVEYNKVSDTVQTQLLYLKISFNYTLVSKRNPLVQKQQKSFTATFICSSDLIYVPMS